MLEAVVRGEEMTSPKWWNSKGEEVGSEEEALVFHPEQGVPVEESSKGQTVKASGSLSDADVERLLKEAVDGEAGFEMGVDGGLVDPNGSGPFTTAMGTSSLFSKA